MFWFNAYEIGIHDNTTRGSRYYQYFIDKFNERDKYNKDWLHKYNYDIYFKRSREYCNVLVR